MLADVRKLALDFVDFGAVSLNFTSLWLSRVNKLRKLCFLLPENFELFFYKNGKRQKWQNHKISNSDLEIGPTKYLLISSKIIIIFGTKFYRIWWSKCKILPYLFFYHFKLPITSVFDVNLIPKPLKRDFSRFGHVIIDPRELRDRGHWPCRWDRTVTIFCIFLSIVRLTRLSSFFFKKLCLNIKYSIIEFQ